MHLTLVLEAGYQTGEKPVTAEVVETVLSRQLGDPELTLARHGYRLKDMTEQFDAKAAEIRAMFSNQLDPKRTAEICERMLAAGLPIRAVICSWREPAAAECAPAPALRHLQLIRAETGVECEHGWFLDVSHYM